MFMWSYGRLISAILACALGVGCGATSQPAGNLPIVKVTIGPTTYTLEVAATPESREHGLMERDTLPVDHGMIFVFHHAAERSFWMFHTRFPLDIIYLGPRGKVVSVHHMKPYDETAVPSNGPAKYAIELSAGQTNKDGVRSGEQLTLPDLKAVLPTTNPAGNTKSQAPNPKQN